MRFSTVSTVVLAISSLAAANQIRHVDHGELAPGVTRLENRSNRRHHNQVGRRSSSSSGHVKRKSCAASPSTSQNTTASQDNSPDAGSDTTQSENSSTTTKTAHKHKSTAKSSSSGSSSSSSNSTSSGSDSGSGSSSNSTSSGSSSSSSSSGGTSGGVAHVTDSKCGSNNPSSTVTVSSGPNGEESWFNCGLQGGGWTPPKMTMEELVYVELTDALASGDSPFAPCAPYFSMFNSVGKANGIPPIMMASFAMQESTCNPKAYSAECYGLFQLSQDKCPDTQACYDPQTNTEKAASFIKTSLASYGNNIVEMTGQYNGWTPGMKQSDVHGECATQQNLDYLHQMFNGWMQGKNGYNIGSIKNCAGNFRKRDLSPRLGSPKKRGLWHF